MPPRPGETGSYGRISLLDGFVLLQNRPDVIYLPARYGAQIREIYGWTGLDRTFLADTTSEQELAAMAETALEVKLIGESGVVKMEVESMGAHFYERLSDAEQENSDIHSYQLILPLWLPGVSAAVEIAHREGFFFGGLLPLWFDRDALLMQKVSGTPDLAKPLLYTDEGKAVMDMIRADLNMGQNHI